MRQKKYYIGVDVGGTKIAAALVDARGKIRARAKHPTPRPPKPQRIYGTVESAVDEVLGQMPPSGGKLAGIGLGVPGVVDKSQTRVLVTPNIDLAGFPLAERLQKKWGCEVRLGNDVNVGLLGEQWLGAGRKARNIVGIFPGTGVGGAVIIDGELLIGCRGAAAEIGHMIVDARGPLCSCGNHGCLEALASRWAIEREIRQAVKEGMKTVVTDLAGPRMTVIKSKVLKEALKRGDQLVETVLTDVARTLGAACVSLRHLFDPQLFILGGGVVEACGKFLLPVIRAAVEKDPFFAGFGPCAVTVSRLGDDAVILGAVALVRRAVEPGFCVRRSRRPAVVPGGNGEVMINRRSYRQSVYIRGDGKIREAASKNGPKFAGLPRELGASDVRKLCKKDPDMLIVAVAGKKAPVFTGEALDVLKAKSVDCRVLPVEEAVELYNNTVQEAALLVVIP